MQRAKVTIRTVADDAGVSVAAVSKVLRNAYGVSDTLRASVNASIEKLGYRPSTAARGMRGRTYTVGVLLIAMDNPFLSQVVEGLKPRLSEADYKLLIGFGEAREAIEVSLIEAMVDLRIDGLILVAPRISGELLARYAREIPMVVLGHHEPTAESFDTVNSDDRLGARMAVKALFDMGCRNIHMVNGKGREVTACDVQWEREAGYREAMHVAGRSSACHVHRIHTFSSAREADFESFFQSRPLPDGVFCWSDIDGVPLLNQAVIRGIGVPDQLAIVGYDNTPAAALPLIGLSSMDQDPDRLSRTAAELLLSRIEGRTTPEHILIEPSLVERRSTVKS